MDFKAVSFFDILLYHLVSYFFFRLAGFGAFFDFLQRKLSFALSEFYINVDMTVGNFFGKDDQRLPRASSAETYQTAERNGYGNTRSTLPPSLGNRDF